MKSVLAVVVGVVLGGVVNMGLILLGGEVIPPPEGVDPSDMESIKENMHRYQPKHFIPPLVAHAVGTLVGAAVAAAMAPRRKMRFALGIGVFYLLGGIAAALMLPAPSWFIATDLVACYLPMGWVGGKLAGREPAESA